MRKKKFEIGQKLYWFSNKKCVEGTVLKLYDFNENDDKSIGELWMVDLNTNNGVVTNIQIEQLSSNQSAVEYLIASLELTTMADHLPWVAEILDNARQMEQLNK